MPSVAFQVATAIAHSREAQMSAASSSKDQPASSPFAEMLDSAAATNGPAPSKATQSDKQAGTNAKKSTQNDDAPASDATEPSQDAEPAKDTTAAPKAETKADAEPKVTKAESELQSDTVAEAKPVEPDTQDTDLAAFMEAVAAATTPKAEQKQDEEKPAETKAGEVAPSEGKGEVKADAKADVKVPTTPDATVLPAAGEADAAALPADDAELKAAATLASVETTPAAASPSQGRHKADEAQVEAALVTDKGPANSKPVEAEGIQAEPAKKDAEATKTQPLEAKASAAPAERPAHAQRADAGDAKPAKPDTALDTASSTKPADVTAPPQPPAQTAPVSSIQSVTPQKDVNSTASAVPVEGVAVEIASKALEGKNRFEIRLDPPELGRIHVRLDVDRHGEITSHVTADRQDTLDLLRREAPQLERALSDAGLRTAGNGLQFSLRDQGHGQQHHQQPLANATRVVINDESLPAEMPRGYYRPAGVAGGLDIRV